MAHVRLLLPLARPLPDHWRLCAALEGEGHVVSIDWRAAPTEPLGLSLVVTLESLLYGGGADREADRAALALARRARGDGARADITFDLTGAPAPPNGAYAPLYDESFADLARDAALLAGRAPALALARATPDGPAIFARARPAIDRPERLANGRRAVTDAVQSMALALARSARLIEPAPCEAAPPRPRGAIAFAAASLAGAVEARLKRLVSHPANWRVGWRALNGGPTTLEAARPPDPRAWTWLADTPSRFYADPFIHQRDGITAIFLEEYPYATGKGVISAFTLDADGRACEPTIIIERPHHLSYPFLFERDGALWMMPESSAVGTLELFRCDAFPFRWSAQGAVLNGRNMSDATLVEIGDQWIMTAAVNAPGASTWDSLSVFRAVSPFGPWREEGGGPLLIDASSARPAGDWAHIDGAWLRPTQDCRAGYGAGLAICRVDDWREGAFAQTIVSRLGPPAGSASHGVHTLNAKAGFEAIDSLGPWTEAAP